jgi:hypothetical protein
MASRLGGYSIETSTTALDDTNCLSKAALFHKRFLRASHHSGHSLEASRDISPLAWTYGLCIHHLRTNRFAQ